MARAESTAAAARHPTATTTARRAGSAARRSYVRFRRGCRGAGWLQLPARALGRVPVSPGEPEALRRALHEVAAPYQPRVRAGGQRGHRRERDERQPGAGLAHGRPPQLVSVAQIELRVPGAIAALLPSVGAPTCPVPMEDHGPIADDRRPTNFAYQPQVEIGLLIRREPLVITADGLQRR